jgi:hypothetical protein
MRDQARQAGRARQARQDGPGGSSRSLLARAWLAVTTLGVLACLAAAPVDAWPAQDTGSPMLTITVLDPTGALVVGARVQVSLDGGETLEAGTRENGAARIELPQPGRVAVRVESPGFETATLDDVRVRRMASRTVKLKLARVYETVDVRRDPRERASDPRSDIFATVLGTAEIQELPDDPDEMERVLREMAGPGAVMRVNGFRGGRLPPKDQIAQIRFHRNMFAADTHEPGFLSVDIITKPGLENWRGSTGVAFRDASMSARNAFAPERGDERHGRGSFTVSGPLWRKHTSIALTVDGTSAYDTQTVVAATLAGAFSESVRRPNSGANGSARLEHALTPAQQLRVEFQRNHAFTDNLGVGNFDLDSRAFRQDRDETILRGSVAGSLGKAMYNEARLSLRTRSISSASATHAPTVSVLNAFTSGGAQVDGTLGFTDLEAADDLDISKGRHALRVGLQLLAGRYRTSEQRNTLGTFTFADLAAYAAQQPTTFTRTVGDPDAAITQTQLATYIQDDYRVNPALTVSGGVRQEYQTTIGGLNLGPRGGITWAPFRSGRTTIRGGAGIFFDWFDAENQLHAVQLDGTHQQIETFLAPAYPAGPQGVSAWLAHGRIQLASTLEQPTIKEANVGVEQTLGGVRLAVMGIHRRGSRELRGVDVNAPVLGVRPDPAAGPVTEVRSIARSGFDGLSVNLNVVRPERRVFIAANYMFARAYDETDTPFSLAADGANPAAERGPSLEDSRHRAMGFASFPLARAVSAGISFTARSALPYEMTTGRDDNGDSLSTDRPAGISRNAARGRASIDASARLAWRTGFGGAATAAPGGPQIRVVRRGGDGNPLADMPGGESGSRYVLEIYAQAFNVFNHLNAQAFGGVIASPFFGQPVSAGAPRRIEIGARLTF